MKIFVPMSDELLDKSAVESANLVPFNPDFLEGQSRKDRKPANWISDCDYTSALRRLRAGEWELDFA